MDIIKDTTVLKKVLGAIVTLLALLCGGQAVAITTCGVGLRLGTAPTIDGQEDGAEWLDASVLNSASACFENLTDYVVATDSYPPRNVIVKSKRYQRGSVWYLGFMFQVQDMSGDDETSLPCGGGTRICAGEKIVMHFNRTINGDEKIQVSEDRRFTLSHTWEGTGDDVTGTITVQDAVSDAGCTAVSTVDSKWGTPGSNGISQAIKKNIVGGGYRVELEVPVSFFNPAGTLTEDIGLAFSIINDFGKSPFPMTDFACTGSGLCEGAGAAYPNGLDVTTDANPVDAICDKGWVIPKHWAVGYLEDPPGEVEISRVPEYWRSNAIRVFECDSVGYTYYPVNPCKTRIEATIKNYGAATTRKIVYLWARHGTGDPLQYNFVDVQDAVLTAGTLASPSMTPVTSILWDGMPTNQTNHPCLRVYIFPDTISNADLNVLKGTSTGGIVSRSNLLNVVANNSVEEKHWAQKNISRHTSITSCPDSECRVSINSFDDIDFSIIKTAMARQNASKTGTIVLDQGRVGYKDDWEKYAKNHVLVQVKTLAYRLPAEDHKPLYAFVENFGGVLQAFPVSMVQESRELPLEFDISNGSKDKLRIKLVYDVFVPDGAPGVNIELPEKVLTIGPESTKTIKGGVINPSLVDDRCGWLPSFCCNNNKKNSIALGGGVLLVGLVGAGFARRRRRS